MSAYSSQESERQALCAQEGGGSMTDHVYEAAVREIDRLQNEIALLKSALAQIEQEMRSIPTGIRDNYSRVAISISRLNEWADQLAALRADQSPQPK
jgi:hypothetical protein